jgi:hypothetical protein
VDGRAEGVVARLCQWEPRRAVHAHVARSAPCPVERRSDQDGAIGSGRTRPRSAILPPAG